MNSLKKYSHQLGIELSDFQISQFEEYERLLLKWNQKINLISKNDEGKIVVHHFFDSLAVSKHLKGKSKGIDIGSGAGFPAVPLKIVNPNISYTLVESIGKKAGFLDVLIKKLKLKNIDVANGRAEDLSLDNSYRKQFDFATVRAVANLEKLIDLCLPFLRKNAILYAYKSDNVESEIERASKAIEKNNFAILDVFSYQLPTTSIVRKVVILKKN